MSIEKDFSDFEAAITKVSREYDAFLYGSHGRIPADSRRQLESMARALSVQQLDSPADRYRFNTLIGRYNAQLERWDRALRQKEEGRGRFAARVAAASPNARPPASVKVPEAVESVRSAAEPDRDLFDRFVRAKRERGDDVGRLSFESFRQQLERERLRLREKTGKDDWEFDIATGGDRIRLAVRPGKRKVT